MTATRSVLFISVLFCSFERALGFTAPVTRGGASLAVGPRPAASAANAALACTAAVLPAARPLQQRRRAVAPQMGLFGLGTPELAIIAGVALLLLGPEQVKSMAKEVGKVSAELKQVPEEFNKGMEVGAQELEARKLESPAVSPEQPPTPPPAA